MINSLVKKVLSEKTIEHVRWFKNFQKASFRSLRTHDILPHLTVQIGQAAFNVSYISQIPLPEWTKVNASYRSLATADEKAQALAELIEGISMDRSFIDIIEQPYLKNIISDKELYQALLGSTYYYNGSVDESYRVFKNSADEYPTPFNYLLAYRAAVVLTDKEATALTVINEALKKFPANDMLKLCLASTYYRTFQTAQANKVLQDISADYFAQIKNFPIAGTAAKNLPVFDQELKDAITNKLLARPKAEYGKVGDSYGEDSVTWYWNQLFYAFNHYNRFQHGWGNLAWSIEDIIQGIISSDPGITQVVDFGTFCANPLYRLSEKNPNLKFMGVDREQTTKKLNDQAFSNSNLEFIAGFITDVLPQQRTNNSTLLFHSRTTTLIYPEQVKRIYKACAENGVKYIATYENFAISRTHMQYYDFEALPAEAVPYGSVMIVHNYPQYMREAGYEIIEERRLPYADLIWKGREQLLGDAHGCVIARLKGA